MKDFSEGFEPLDHTDPFGERAGPFSTKRSVGEDGVERFWFGLRVENKHTNGHNRGHGGLTMTLADEALGAAAWEAADGAPSVTISLHVDFIGAVREGAWLEAAADTTKRTKSMVFVQGRLYCDGEVIANATGTWRLLDISKFNPSSMPTPSPSG